MDRPCMYLILVSYYPVLQPFLKKSLQQLSKISNITT